MLAHHHSFCTCRLPEVEYDTQSSSFDTAARSVSHLAEPELSVLAWLGCFNSTVGMIALLLSLPMDEN